MSFSGSKASKAANDSTAREFGHGVPSSMYRDWR
jgi:hypothetical protein